MARRTLYLTALVVAAVLLACVLALLAAPHKAEAAFPGKNGRIAFSAKGYTDEDNHQIFTVRPDGTGEKQLTATTTAAFNTEPSFSSDGRKIAWNRNGDIWVMNADGTGKRRFTSGPTFDSSPVFSPDGRRVAFVRYGDIYLKALDGAGLRRVTDDQGSEREPVFSPNGRRIAFSWYEAIPGCDRCTDWSEIATVRSDGTGMRAITDLPDQVDAQSPDWSPDGRKLVFAVHSNVGEEKVRIETVGADGTGQRTVFAPNSVFPSDPVFSPDGTKIAFSYQFGADIWTINPDGTGLTNTTNTSTERREMTPAWQPRLATAR